MWSVTEPLITVPFDFLSSACLEASISLGFGELEI